MFAHTCSAPQPASASLGYVSVHSKSISTYQGKRNIPHVGRWLNRGHKLERNVDQTDERDDGGRDVVPELVSGKNAANEEVDCSVLVSFSIPIESSQLLLSMCGPPLRLSF